MGGKAASLAVMAAAGLPIPDGFYVATHGYREFVDGNRRYRPTPHFEHEGHTIWGLTGRLTVDLLEVIRNLG